MWKNRKKIGIMGGTFDPIHIGHLILGEIAYEQYQLDKVLFMPAGNPPHKKNRKNGASNQQRVEMVKRAIASNSHFELSLEEMNKTTYTYTYKTLEELKKQNSGTDYYFILGADSLYDFEEWKEPSRILQACTVLVAVRNHTSDEQLDNQILFLEKKYHGKIEKLNSPTIDIASKELRARIADGNPIIYYVPDKVDAYIRENNIYKDCDKHDI